MLAGESAGRTSASGPAGAAGLLEVSASSLSYSEDTACVGSREIAGRGGFRGVRVCMQDHFRHV